MLLGVVAYTCNLLFKKKMQKDDGKCEARLLNSEFQTDRPT